jgi:multisubunit Na+/H+ antiporter MnhC subunit
MKGAATKSDDPAVADSANAPVLKEYGFQRLEKAAYTRDDGRNLAIKAAVFADASGAYGAFTYYYSEEMGQETIGGQAAFLNNRVLFYQGNILVDAVFDRMSVMSASQMRQLAGLLPQPADKKDKLPSLPARLPKGLESNAGRSLEKNTTKYILGPVALDRVGSPLPSAMVDFKSDAEVVMGKYPASAGDATLMLIEYPTPQIAAERLRQIDASHQITQQQPGVAPILDVGPYFASRTGPIIVIAAGPLSKSAARSLMSSISYEADVTWNENTYVTKKDNLANFLFNAIVLCGIVVGLALVAGVAFGGLRLLVKRLFPDSVFDRRETTEFISLHLQDDSRPVPRDR